MSGPSELPQENTLGWLEGIQAVFPCIVGLSSETPTRPSLVSPTCPFDGFSENPQILAACGGFPSLPLIQTPQLTPGSQAIKETDKKCQIYI